MGCCGGRGWSMGRGNDHDFQHGLLDRRAAPVRAGERAVQRFAAEDGNGIADQSRGGRPVWVDRFGAVGRSASGAGGGVAGDRARGCCGECRGRRAGGNLRAAVGCERGDGGDGEHGGDERIGAGRAPDGDRLGDEGGGPDRLDDAVQWSACAGWLDDVVGGRGVGDDWECSNGVDRRCGGDGVPVGGCQGRRGAGPDDEPRRGAEVDRVGHFGHRDDARADWGVSEEPVGADAAGQRRGDGEHGGGAVGHPGHGLRRGVRGGVACSVAERVVAWIAGTGECFAAQRASHSGLNGLAAVRRVRSVSERPACGCVQTAHRLFSQGSSKSGVEVLDDRLRVDRRGGLVESRESVQDLLASMRLMACSMLYRRSEPRGRPLSRISLKRRMNSS